MQHMARLALLMIMSALIPAGCAPSTPMPVIVEVADARTGEPIEDVVVRASGATFYIPTMESSTLGAPGAEFGPPPNPEGAVGSTDLLGQLHMTIAGQRPVYFHFFKSGYPEGYLVVESGESQVMGALTWTTGSSTPGIERAVILSGDPEPANQGPVPRMMFRIAASTNLTADPFAQQ